MSRVQLRTRGWAGAYTTPRIESANTWRTGSHAEVKYVEDLGTDLRDAIAQRTNAEARIGNIVQELRTAGASWAVVGHLLGITKAAAHKRYGHDELTSSKPSTRRHAPVDENVNPATPPAIAGEAVNPATRPGPVDERQPADTLSSTTKP